MNTLRCLAFIAAAAVPALAQAPKITNESPLIVDGPVTVDAGDVRAYLLRVPEDKRANFMTSHDRIATVADAVFIARSLAAKARAEGIDRDPIVQRRLAQVQDAVLADLYTQKLEKEAKEVKLDQRARELYMAEPARYRVPEKVDIEAILVDMNGRTREMARERAMDIYNQAKSGKEEFLTLAARYSDDPNKTRNGGALGFNDPETFKPAARDAIRKLKSKGDITAPIETESGYQLFRLAGRKPAETVKFEAVREQIIEAERERLKKQRGDAVVQEIRSSPTVVTHRGNTEALVVPIDPEVMKRIQELHKQ